MLFLSAPLLLMDRDVIYIHLNICVNGDDRFMLNKRREYCILSMKRYTETEGYIEKIWV